MNDRVVQNLVWHSLGSDPALAVNQIARITDERRRNWMYRRTLENWIEQDPAAANSWLQNNPLPQDVANRLNTH